MLFYFYGHSIIPFLEQKFEADELIDLYNPNALKDLRAKYNLKADKYSLELSQVARGADHKRFFGKVKLEAFCAIKERIGDVDDGGKYVCNPRDSNVGLKSEMFISMFINSNFLKFHQLYL